MKKLYPMILNLKNKTLTNDEIYNAGGGIPDSPEEATAVIQAIETLRRADPRLIDALIRSPIQQNM